MSLTGRNLACTRCSPQTKAIELKWGTVDMSYGLFVGSFTIKNNNSYAVADLRISCQVTAPSGTQVGAYDFTLYEVVGANKSKTVRHRFGLWPDQGKSVSCGV